METVKQENTKLRSDLEEAQRQANHAQSLEKANQELQQKLNKLESSVWNKWELTMGCINDDYPEMDNERKTEEGKW